MLKHISFANITCVSTIQVFARNTLQLYKAQLYCISSTTLFFGPKWHYTPFPLGNVTLLVTKQFLCSACFFTVQYESPRPVSRLTLLRIDFTYFPLAL
jgi:hypothetical protein